MAHSRRRNSSPDDKEYDENTNPEPTSQDDNTTPKLTDDTVFKRDLLGLIEKIGNRLTDRDLDRPSRLTLFLRAFPTSSSPLRLNQNSLVLYARLKFILDFANNNCATTFVLAVLDEQDQLKVQGRLLLQPKDISVESWYNQFLEIYGPQTSTIMRQMNEPRPFPDETMERFVQRLSLNSLRVPNHPCEQIGISKFVAVVSSTPEFATIIVNNP